MPIYYVQVAGREVGLDITTSHGGTVVRVLGGEGEEPGETGTSVDFAPVLASPVTGEGLYSLIAGGRSYQVYVERTEEGYRIVAGRYRFDTRVLTAREWRLEKVAPRQSLNTGELVVKAPMPGLVKQILVSVGDEVEAGARLLVLEAMKMENDINAPRPGRVATLHVTPATVVENGRPLITLE